jgi:hypothetical protein
MVIGVALAAAALLLAFFFNSMAPPARAQYPAPTIAMTQSADTPTATAVPSITPTFTPIAEATITPNAAPGLDLDASPTPDALTKMIASGGLAFSGPLPPEKQIAVYEASTAYIQASVADSIRAAKEINEVGYGDPSNICGPLAIAILQDAGLVPYYLSPHDYWLLDPTKPPDKRLIQNAFPATLWTHEVITTPINKMDWTAAPLEPGDFVFIWHGSGGNFDHMLVVNRVDSQGRTYAVTNFGTSEGYLIAETMLYDPQDPTVGIFHTWTQEREAILGSTGFGGYEVWRMRAS